MKKQQCKSTRWIPWGKAKISFFSFLIILISFLLKVRNSSNGQHTSSPRVWGPFVCKEMATAVASRFLVEAQCPWNVLEHQHLPPFIKKLDSRERNYISAYQCFVNDSFYAAMYVCIYIIYIDGTGFKSVKICALCIKSSCLLSKSNIPSSLSLIPFSSASFLHTFLHHPACKLSSVVSEFLFLDHCLFPYFFLVIPHVTKIVLPLIDLA